MKKAKILFGLVILGFSIVFLVTHMDSLPGPDEDSPNLTAGRNVNMISGTRLPDGDPFLQKQNEPSLAVSTRNPFHILAGANDYRTVNMDDEDENEMLPSPVIAAGGDAWLGLYKSFDGGQSWKSMLHPGFPQDTTTVGEHEEPAEGQTTSPLKEFKAAADPVVRAGPSGMFYYAGIAFNRPDESTPPGQEKGCVFVSRFIDDNNKEKGDTIRFLDTRVIEDGTRGRFIDKPCLAVGIPQSNSSVQISGPGGDTQCIPAHPVYLAFSVFPGNNPQNHKSQIWVHYSKNCGEETPNWDKTKVSEGRSINQGVSIAVDPRNSDHVYVAWRRFSGYGNSNAILICRSTDGGQHFSDPVVIATIAPFDQGSTPSSFRTNSYPSLAVDDQGIVYAAWAERKLSFFLFRPFLSRRALVRIATCDTSTLGENDPLAFSDAEPIDQSGQGHQFMPSLAFGAGRLIAVWYDQRNDRSGRFTRWIDGIEHTIDVRAAEAIPGPAPSFQPSIQVSRYLFYLRRSVPESVASQLQYNHPNYPLFKKGTQPFIGDYIEVTPAPMFVPNEDGNWVYNSEDSQTPLFHAAWTDNRDVKVPQNQDWTDYNPPRSDQEEQFMTEPESPALKGQTRIRDQNVYTASLTGGLIAGSPGNSKPLREEFWRSFVIYVKNMSRETKRFRLTVDAPANLNATFSQNETDPCRETLDVTIPSRSGIARTVFVKGPDGNKDSFSVKIEEIDEPEGNPVEGGLKSIVTLNPDIENPDIENPDIENPTVPIPDIENAEVHNPDIENPDIENPDIENPEVYNPDIENPDIENTEIINPDIENPDIENPDIENLDVVNPDIENPDIENAPFFFFTGHTRDKTWNIRNNGNTSSSYTFKLLKAEDPFLQTREIKYQLLIYRIHTCPVAVESELKERHHDELLASILNPVIYNPDIENSVFENPDIENPDIENPDIENGTFFLAPGDEAKISLRGYEKRGGYWLPFQLEGFEGILTSHAINSEDEFSAQPFYYVSSNYETPQILNKKHRLPSGQVGTPYSEQAVVAIGGTTPYTWTWTALSYSEIPPGLEIDRNTGVISGTPTAQGHYAFIVIATDQNNASASKRFFVIIH